MTPSRTILVAGASGNLGGAVTRALMAKGMQVIAGTTRPEEARIPDGARVVKLVYEQPDTVESALRNVDGLFLVAPPLDPHAPAKLAPVIERSRAAGVKHIVFTSALGVDQNEAAPLRLIERQLMDAGVETTILRPNFFMENFSTGFIAPMIAQGGIFLAAGDARTSFISVEDIAAVAATAFEKRQVDVAYNLTGPEALDHTEVARILSAASGKDVRYHAIPEADMLAGARSQGMPAGAVEYLAMLYQAVRNGWAAAITADVEQVLGRPPMTFDAFVRTHAEAWK